MASSLMVKCLKEKGFDDTDSIVMVIHSPCSCRLLHQPLVRPLESAQRHPYLVAVGQKHMDVDHLMHTELVP